MENVQQCPKRELGPNAVLLQITCLNHQVTESGSLIMVTHNLILGYNYASLEWEKHSGSAHAVQCTLSDHEYKYSKLKEGRAEHRCSVSRVLTWTNLLWVCVAMFWEQGPYKGAFCEKLLEAFPMSNRANASRLQDRPTIYQGWANQWQW